MGLFSNWLKKSNNGSKATSSKPYEIHSTSLERAPVKAREYNLFDLICGKYEEYRNINSMMEKLAEVLRKGNYVGDLDEARKRLEKITDKYAGVNSGKNELRRDLVNLETLIGIRGEYDKLNPFYKKEFGSFSQFVRDYASEEDTKLEERYRINGIYATEQGRLDFSSLRKFNIYNRPVKLKLAYA